MGQQSAKVSDSVLLIGVGTLGTSLSLERPEEFGLSSDQVKINSYAWAGIERKLDSVSPPAVVVLGVSSDVEAQVARLRRQWPDTAIIICGSYNQLPDVFPLLSRGVSDFISTTASPAELREKCLIRVGAYRNRVRDSLRVLGPLTINLMNRTVTNGKSTLSLTPIEIKIVTVLADSLGSVVQRDFMKKSCWGDAEITDNALNRKIYEVRRSLRKLSEDVNIRTIYGLGFELSVDGSTPHSEE